MERTFIVTSQMDIDATLGNLEKQQEYDFSRIQARFTTRISLTSANADEVIQRRLLEKKPEPQTVLCAVYERQKNIIIDKDDTKTLSAIKAAIEEAKQLGKNKITDSKGRIPANLKQPLRDGDHALLPRLPAPHAPRPREAQGDP